MAHSDALRRILQRIDRKGYKAYRDIKGSYEFPGFRLTVDHVQGDPFAAPSRVRVKVSHGQAGFDHRLFDNRSREIAFRDYLTRAFHQGIRRFTRRNRGIGKSGLIAIDRPGQEILERSSVLILGEGIEARFVVGLPAAGRTVLGHEAMQMFFEEIPKIIDASLTAPSLDHEALSGHVACAEDQDAMRGQLADLGLVAFLATGSILPRRSGVDDRPLADRNVVPLQSPATLEATLERPNGGPIRGLGIPRGVVLIAGGGFHGKSTLLNAVQRSVYNHIPGDGRENAVTCAGAVKIKAEDGRYIEHVNIAPFIQNLPFGKNTRRFSTDNASGSTSQAANIMEAVEIGAELFLIDEDTSATNFMIRDERMQALVAKEKEPITPFVDKVRQLYDEHDASTVLVMGGSGDYFDVADRVIMMDHYRPVEVTDQVSHIRSEYISRRRVEGGEHFGEFTPRIPLRESFEAKRGRKEVKINAKGLRHILYGRTPIDLTQVEQLVDESQTRAIGALIYYYAERYATGHLTLNDGLKQVFELLAKEGLDPLSPGRAGDLAVPRIQEVAAAINRMRSLKIR